jgi:DNA-binding FadR family transcriptional regulator
MDHLQMLTTTLTPSPRDTLAGSALPDAPTLTGRRSLREAVAALRRRRATTTPRRRTSRVRVPATAPLRTTCSH